ncbi:DEAD/DEAH box helicase [Phycisphaera mikurensis]|nr:DEAD/DEAH box helicase [Phycisphaera mikurensis]MBB6442592.1 hypothetical protein [Phycisphaera mikurensis]
MRPMQEKVWQRRGEPYLLIKSPPASGKSRALMFVALDKLHRQGLKQAIVLVPTRDIGASFGSVPLSAHGFFADWEVRPRWNLCDAPGPEDSGGKVDAFGAFLASEDRVLVCTHATFRFAVDKLGVEALDGRLVAVDEFHHVSASPDNRLGEQVRALIERDEAHLVAMTGSYFRGDAAAVLTPEDEARFETVTYTYHEQLAGYTHLKHLDIGFCFYTGRYADDVAAVLDPDKKTIVHIPNVNARESMGDKVKEVEHILSELGEFDGVDPATGFLLMKRPDGRVLRVADLVDDDPARRNRVAAALASERIRDRDFVDLIIALGMAKEGFDWIWCEHVLTIGYRASLTEVVQIIGRATRDAPGKARARFTNLIAEPDASEVAVIEAVNDTLKAIAASLLMEQVLAPKFEFRPKNSGPVDGLDYGERGYAEGGNNIGVDPTTGAVQIEIAGLKEPASKEAKRVCREDVHELIAAFVQDRESVERGMFDEELVPEEITQLRQGKIVRERYPQLDAGDQEAVRQQAVAALNLLQEGKRRGRQAAGEASGEETPNTALIDGLRKLAVDVKDLDIDLVDAINPFRQAYEVLAKSLNEGTLTRVKAAITAKKSSLSEEEARALMQRAVAFKKQRGVPPSATSPDPWERRMAEGVAFMARLQRERARATA